MIKISTNRIYIPNTVICLYIKVTQELTKTKQPKLINLKEKNTKISKSQLEILMFLTK